MNTIPQHAPHARPVVSASNAALLIDFDNVTMGIRSDLQTQLRRLLDSEMIKGKVAVQRAYADWRRYPQYIAPLSEASVDLIFAPAFGSNKKNATDIRLAIDALELVFTRPEIGTFILLSGDSDFSSLVLKLKEYGKYVIGVGIRESASDLLVQNCDEYYSYTELTGLKRTDEVEVKRRDPWELVIEAVVRMQANDDVMRSDRLKQVMQELDPHFDEKDAGVNKFSKFVVEAGRRGLVTLSKLDNGQFEVGIGPDANVRLPHRKEDPAPSQPSRRKTPDSAETASAGSTTLADAFAQLRKALEALGAQDGESVAGDRVRTRMKEMSSDPEDAIFESRRFQRLLRQAHDASVIDLTRAGRGYRVTLSPAAEESDEGGGQPQEKPARRPRRKKKSTAKSTAAPDESKPSADEDEKTPEPKAETPSREPKKEESGTRGSLYRRGSKGGRGRPARDESEPVASDETGPARSLVADIAAPTQPAARSGRSIGPRSGSRGRRGRSKTAESGEKAEAAGSRSEPVKPEERQTKPDASRTVPSRSGSGGEERRERKPAATPARGKDADRDEAPAASETKPTPTPPAPTEEGENSLLRRMSAAVQRALLGDED